MEKVSKEFICKCLAELFDFPCNFSPPEDALHNTEEKCQWCEENCGKATAADCWLHYFQIKFEERNKDNE